MATKPTERNESRWYVAQRLNLERVEAVTSPESLFESIMNTSASAREFFPMSSYYVSDPLAKTLIGNLETFAHGSEELPRSRHPELKLRWSFTVRFGLLHPYDPLPRKRLIVRKRLSGDTSGYSCWAWYSQGMNRFIFEYGHHNVEDTYPSLEFFFDPAKISTNFSSLNLVGLMVNTTHAAAYLQGAHDQVTLPLPHGVVPSDCANGVAEVGDVDVKLAWLEYHPRFLTQQKLREIQLEGQTLQDIAAGRSRATPAALDDDESAEMELQTQRLVREYGSSGIAVSKLSGSLAYISSESSPTFENHSSLHAAAGVRNHTPVGRPATPSGDPPLWPAEDLGDELAFWQVLGEEGVDMRDEVTVQEVKSNATAAFLGLRAASRQSFTVSWWARASGDPEAHELLFWDTGRHSAIFEVRFDVIGAGESAIRGWTMAFHDAPWCNREDPELRETCAKSPSAWCEVPEGVSYDGIWRHYALKYEHDGAGDGASLLQLFLDGTSLCGIKFSTDPDLVPHTASGGALEVFVGTPLSLADNTSDPLELRDVRVYPRGLTGAEVHEIAVDPAMQECLDLTLNADNATWVSKFGQTCTDLAEMSSASGDMSAPAACEVPEFKHNCPVSCMHNLAPMCYDGSPPLPKPNTSLSIAARSFWAQFYLDSPEEANGWRPSNLSDSELEHLVASEQWLSNAAHALWQDLFHEVRSLEQAMIMPSHDAVEAVRESPNSTFFIASYNLSDDGWCPGIGIDYEMLWPDYNSDHLYRHAVIEDLCMSEWQTWSKIDEIAGRNGLDRVTTAGWHEWSFQHGLLERGSSSTIYYWAKTSNLSSGTSPKVVGLDFDYNLCFSVRGSIATLQQHGLVERFEAEADTITHENAMADSLEGIEVLTGESGSSHDSNASAEWHWSNGRLTIEISSSLHHHLKENEWNFFGLSVDTHKNLVSFAVNDAVKTVPLQGEPKDWGCNSLEYLSVTGADMKISPVRVGAFPLSPGSLQRLYQTTRYGFLKTLTGEQESQLQRRIRIERTVRHFNSRIVALAPPIVLQRRIAGAPGDFPCTGETADAVNNVLERFKDLKCSPPYKCSDVHAVVECARETGEVPQSFLGQKPVKVDGSTFFPEFAWTLESSVIVRDGAELSPRDDYIDFHTREVQLWMIMFVPTSKIVTVVQCTFDMSSIKTKAKTDFKQLKMLESHELTTVLGWSIAGVIMALFGVLLAFRAAVKEAEDLFKGIISWLDKISPRALPRTMRMQVHKRQYNNNTSQPDLLDVGLNLVLMIMLIIFSVDQADKVDRAPKLFADIANIDWGGESEFEHKIDSFLSGVEEARELVQVEETFIGISFWILLVCCARLMMYMKVHPRIGSITETFASTANELGNFLFSFGVIYVFLAYVAHVRFGYLYDEFSTIEQSLITLFSILIGDTIPDYYNNTMLCIFIVGFVFICSFSLLNFLLAIVVNGYTKVEEYVLENEVAQNVLEDLAAILWDTWLWQRHPSWPSRLSLLMELQNRFPEVFMGEEEVFAPLSREVFHQVTASASRGKASDEDADRLFKRYLRLPVLVVVKGSTELGQDENTYTAPGREHLQHRRGSLFAMFRNSMVHRHTLTSDCGLSGRFQPNGENVTDPFVHGREAGKDPQKQPSGRKHNAVHPVEQADVADLK